MAKENESKKSPLRLSELDKHRLFTILETMEPMTVPSYEGLAEWFETKKGLTVTDKFLREFKKKYPDLFKKIKIESTEIRGTIMSAAFNKLKVLEEEVAILKAALAEQDALLKQLIQAASTPIQQSQKPAIKQTHDKSRNTVGQG